MRKQIRFEVSQAQDEQALCLDLIAALRLLAESDAESVDTILLIHPQALYDFFDYNDFLEVADRILEQEGYLGEFQIASFHPDYQFADSKPGAIENYTNRSPFPILHILRESSIDRAVKAFPDAADIYDENIKTMKKLGLDGWMALFE